MTPSAAGSQSFLSWSTVIEPTQSFSLFTTTVRPSMATGSSMKSTPAPPQRSTSSCLTGREASLMSVPSVTQNFLKPPPVPDSPTVTLTLPPVSLPNSSPTASEMGKTVLEPSMAISPPRPAYGSPVGAPADTVAAAVGVGPGVVVAPAWQATAMSRRAALSAAKRARPITFNF